MSPMGPKPRPLAERFWEKVDKTDSCWLWTAATNRKGYGIFSVARMTCALAHRVSWKLEHGSDPVGVLLHTCDTPNCVRPSHLVDGTIEQNNKDMAAKGRAARRPGELAPWAVLKQHQVDRIRAMKGTVRQVDLAAEYGVSRSHISAIQRGKTWVS